MSDSKFDDKIRESLEGHEPNVNPNWDKMRDRIAAAAAIGAVGVDAYGSKIATQLSIGAAVVIGAASMWIAQKFMEVEEIYDVPVVVEEIIEIGNEELTPDEIAISAIDEEDDEYAEKVVAKVSNDAVAEDDVAESGHDSINEESLEAISEGIDNSNEADIGSEDLVVSEVVSEVEEVPFRTTSQTSCVGAQVEFQVDGSDMSMSYLWNFGDGHFSSEANPTHTYDMPGVYDVTLSLISPGKGSIKTRTIENLITINPQPEANMKWAFSRINTGSKVQIDLIDNTINANSATWIVDGEIIPNSQPLLDNPGKYQINLIASNQFGCQDYTSSTVIVGDRNQLNAPARFSPDGDGRYDSFMPFGLNNLSDDWELIVADKDGKEVYSTTSLAKPWIGALPDGSLAENGSLFYWTVVYTDYEGNQQVYTDKITVER